MEGFDDNNMPVTPGNTDTPNGTDMQNTGDVSGNTNIPDAAAGQVSVSETFPAMGAAQGTDSFSGASASQDFSQQGGVFNSGSSDYMSPVFMQTPPADPGSGKKKKKIWPLVVALVAVVLVGGGVILFLMKDVIANSIAKSSKSPEEYLQYVVENQDWDKSLKGYETAYKQMADMDQMKVEGEVRFQMSEDIMEATEDAISDYINKSNSYYSYYWDDDDKGNTDIRLDAWQDIALKFEGQRGEDGASAMQAIQLKDKDYLLTIEEMYDASKSTAYIRVPQINEDYAAVKLSNFLKDDELDLINGIFAGNSNVYNAMPSPKVVSSMKERYMAAILEQIEDVDMSEDKLVINGQSQKCTVLSFEYDEDLQKNIMLAVIKEMQNDSDLEDAFYNFMKESAVGTDVDPDEIWEQIMAELEKAETALDDYEADVEPEIQLYVDNKGKIIGGSMIDGKDVLLGGYIVKGGKAYFELSATQGKKELFSVTGEGSVGLSGVSMKGTIFIEEADELEIPFSVENVSDKGGVFRLELEPICDLIRDEAKDDEVDELLDLLEGDFVVEIKRNDMDVTESFYIDNDGEKQIGISYSIKLSKADDLEFPTNKQTVKVNSTMELLPYLGDCDLDELVDALEQLGLPKNTADELREELEYVKSY